MSFDLSALYTLLGSVWGVITALGGIAGLVSLYLLWKSSRKKVELINATGYFAIEAVAGKDSGLNVVTNLTVFNGTDEPISITDAIGVIKVTLQENSGTTTRGISVKPINSNKIFPKNLSAHESMALLIIFKFPDTLVNSVERMRVAKFVGFKEDVPIAVATETGGVQDPLNLRIAIHVNGDRVLARYVPVYDKADLRFFEGSLNPVEIARIEKEFVEGKR